MRDVVLKASMDGTFGDDVNVLLGCAGESAVTKLIFALPLLDGNYYIDIELPNGQKTKDTLVKNGEFWEYIVSYPVTENVGVGSLQVVVNSHSELNEVIWKTAILATKVQASINATDFIVNDHKDILAKMDDKILGLENEVNNKIDKQFGKGLSTEDYTTAEQTKLAGVENNANNYSHPATHSLDIITETEIKKIMTANERTKLANQSGTNTGDQDLSVKVDKIVGKSLSTNDFTDTLKLKVDGISGINTGDETTSTIKTKLGIATLSGINTGDQDISGLIPLTQKASANGVATLNANSKVVQMPEVQKISTIVSNPDFTTQPAINGGGNLDASFERWETNFYYVTLKDTTGVALPSGQFKLTLTKDGYATAVNQLFLLTSLATGNSGTLAENTAIDFSAIGVSWKMRLRYVMSISINLTGNLQLSDMQIDVSGTINQTHYLYVRLTPFNTTDYSTLSNVGTYNGDTGFLFGNSIGQTKKFIFNSTLLRLLRKTKEISAIYQYSHFGSDTLSGTTTSTPLATNGILYAKSRANINTTPITNIFIWANNVMQFANGTEITIKELL